MRRACEVIAFVLTACALCFAQNTASNEQETIRLLTEEVRELRARVEALEGRPAAQNAPAAEAQPAQESSSPPSGPAQPIRQWSGIQWRGFAEFDYKVLDQRQPELGTSGFNPGSAGNFYTGDFDLFLTSRISDRASVLAEIVLAEGDAQSFSLDVERALVKYDYNDHLKMSFGRYHTGVDYYNTAFFNDKWLQTTADRPLIVELSDDGGVLPTQAVGVTVTGSVPSGKLGLNYLFEYGSADTIRPRVDGSGISDDENNGNHVTVGIFARPEAIRGLQIGAAFYHDKLSAFARGPTVRVDQTIVNGYAVYSAHGIEFLSEGFLIRHSIEHSPLTFNMPAFYSQLSKKFGAVRPFVRYQYVNANPNSIFPDVLLRQGPSLGVRYDFNESMAWKTQLDHTLRKGRADLNGLQTQLILTF